MIKENIKDLSSEKRNVNSLDIDKKSTLEICKIINDEDNTIASSVQKELDSISKVVDDVVFTLKNGGRLIYTGAGTSGRIGLIDAVECRPTYSVPDEEVLCVMAGGKDAFVKAKEGVEDSKEEAVLDLKNISLSGKDILIGLAASGRTPYVIGALEYGKMVGAKTVAIACVKNSLIGNIADKKIEVFTGAEVVSGSTRMKAGTAQKMVCNMITTASMIKLGKVYNNLMVDVSATNQKLIKRAVGIIEEITGEDEKICEEKMLKYKSVKKAVISILLNIESSEEIEKMLKDNEDNLRKIIGDR